MKPQIVFTEELLNKTARELGYSRKTMQYLYQFMLEYLYKQIESTDCCAFRFPYLGLLHVKADYVDDTLHETAAALKKQPDSTFLRKKLVALQHKDAKLKQYMFDLNRAKSKSVHHIKDKIQYKRIHQGYSIEEMQDIQNEEFLKSLEDA